MPVWPVPRHPQRPPNPSSTGLPGVYASIPGTNVIDVTVVGDRAIATANGLPGTPATGQDTTVVGDRAIATASGPTGATTFGTGLFGDGTFGGGAASFNAILIVVSGDRAIATANGQGGTVLGGLVTVAGARAIATANGQGGTIAIPQILGIGGGVGNLQFIPPPPRTLVRTRIKVVIR